ncbi:LGFP repeat-containing protein [Corynebacterium sp. H130]|uniref:LGFP repeat-containing protein n=1 Tax=Corynebacterium sp. H130 TaxID=3133444 RepID=UPI00309BF7B7
MTAAIKKLGATITVLATIAFNPVPASAQETELTTQVTAPEAFDPATADPVAPTTNLDELRAPGERDIYDVDTSDWDFNEPGMNKNNIDNHYYEHALPTDLGEPQPEIIPGKMRSDRIPLPDGVTKEQADKAEVLEAKQRGITKPGEEPLIQPMAAENCRTYWPREHQVCGAIREKYESMAIAWAGQNPINFLGLPRSDELTNPDGVGKRTEFDNGFIYWHPDTGAWSVTTHNSIVWARNGWEQGRLGYPTSDEIGTGDNVGRKQSFQRGRIYGTLSGHVSIEGKILEKWIETGEEKGPLGYPATDEEGTPDGIGRFNRFALGMIYWHPQHGAHPILQPILRTWSEAGYEISEFGYPTSDQQKQEDYFVQSFENGTLEVPWVNLLASIGNIPYLLFPSEKEAHDFFDALEQGLIPLSELGISSSTPSTNYLTQTAGARTKRYGPCELQVENIHFRKSGDWNKVGFKPVTRCEYPINSVQHKSTLRYKYYHLWKKAPDAADQTAIVTKYTSTKPKHQQRGFTVQYISKDVEQQCEGNVKTSLIGVTEGTIQTAEGVFYARAYSSPTRLECEIP